MDKLPTRLQDSSGFSPNFPHAVLWTSVPLYLIVFILNRMIIIRSRKNNYSLYFFQSIGLLLHRRKAPAKQGIVPIYVSQELFCPFPFLAGSSGETSTMLVNYPLPIRNAYQNLRRMPAFSFHFLWKSPPRSLAKSA